MKVNNLKEKINDILGIPLGTKVFYVIEQNIKLPCTMCKDSKKVTANIKNETTGSDYVTEITCPICKNGNTYDKAYTIHYGYLAIITIEESGISHKYAAVTIYLSDNNNCIIQRKLYIRDIYLCIDDLLKDFPTAVVTGE